MKDLKSYLAENASSVLCTEKETPNPLFREEYDTTFVGAYTSDDLKKVLVGYCNDVLTTNFRVHPSGLPGMILISGSYTANIQVVFWIGYIGIRDEGQLYFWLNRE